MSIQETSSMVDFLFIVKDLLGQIVGVGDVIRDEDVLTVLNAFPDSYENFVQSVSAQWTLPNFDQLTSRLLQEAQRRELHGDQTKSEEALLLKFKNLLKKKKIDKEPEFAKILIKSKEEASESEVEGEAANAVEEEMKENEALKSVDFFETVVANLETRSNKSPADCWYLDSGAAKHVLGDKSSFRGLESSVKIQNVKSVKSAGGQTRGVYGKRKATLSSTSLKK
ncbi:unnamed protein product [Sphagnum jensenii]